MRWPREVAPPSDGAAAGSVARGDRVAVRLAIIAALALLPAIGLVGAGCGSDAPSPVHTSANRNIQVRPGEQFQISLDAIGEDGGYKWHMRRSGDEVVPIRGQLIHDPILDKDGKPVTDENGMPPVPGPMHNLWTFRAAHVGRGTVTFRQYQAWMAPSKSDSTVTFDITVAE